GPVPPAPEPALRQLPTPPAARGRWPPQMHARTSEGLPDAQMIFPPALGAIRDRERRQLEAEVHAQRPQRRIVAGPEPGRPAQAIETQVGRPGKYVPGIDEPDHGEIPVEQAGHDAAHFRVEDDDRIAAERQAVRIEDL